MVQLIDKDALVAEIEKLRKKNDAYDKPSHIADVCCKEFLSLIDTLEVKEVDLNKNNLTWEDISAIRHTMARLRRQFSNDNQVVNNEKFCKEVLNRFKAQKGE